MTLTVQVPPYIWPCSEADYHNDATGHDRPSLSQSTATTLITRSPLHAQLEHPRFGGARKKATAAMDRGSLVHRLLLGAGADVVAVDADDWRTKAAKDARDEIREAGNIPVLVADLEDAEQMVETVRRRLADFGFSFHGESEVAIVWEVETAHGPVLCRMKCDHLIADQGILLDLKTTGDAHPRTVQRRFYDGGADIQWAAYTSGFRALRPDLAGREEMVFLYAETEYPYLVTPVRPDGTMRALGESRWQRAVDIWARCLATGEWPGYTGTILDIEAPMWALREEEEVHGLEYV